MNAIVLERHDGSPQTAAGDDLVPGLEGVQHGRPFFLAALLGKNQQEVKDAKDENERECAAHPSHSATARLHR